MGEHGRRIRSADDLRCDSDTLGVPACELLELIDRDRIDGRFARLAEITSTPGYGITRLAFSEEDARARLLVQEYMEAAELAVRVDAVGNVIGRRSGVDPTRPVIMTGSHIDSVPNGGNFDGPVGVIGAIEALHAMRDAGIQALSPIEVVLFASEEAPRFSQSAHRFGSRVMAGLFDLSLVNELRDRDGVTLAEALLTFGIDPDNIGKARRAPGEIGAFVELHIEQGTGLLRAASSIGVVTRITGTTRYLLEISGQSAHSGGTPMGDRHDALVAAAEVVLLVERVAREIGGSLVGTVGSLSIQPGSISVIPGTAVVGIDIRDIRAAQRTAAAAMVRAEIESICSKRAVQFRIHTIRDDPPVQLSERIQRLTEAFCTVAGLTHMRIPSHTGHDAASISRIAETGMIFVRNASGASHSQMEAVDTDDIATGVQALLGTLLQLAIVAH